MSLSHKPSTAGCTPVEQTVPIAEDLQLIDAAGDSICVRSNWCVLQFGRYAVAEWVDSGAGKSYTMFGANKEQQRGIIPRAVEHLFRCSLLGLELGLSNVALVTTSRCAQFGPLL